MVYSEASIYDNYRIMVTANHSSYPNLLAGLEDSSLAVDAVRCVVLDPAEVLVDTSVHAGVTCTTAAITPTHNSNLVVVSTAVLEDKRTTGVSLAGVLPCTAGTQHGVRDLAGAVVGCLTGGVRQHLDGDLPQDVRRRPSRADGAPA